MLARKKEKRRVSMRMCERDGAATGERAGERGKRRTGPESCLPMHGSACIE